MSPRPSASRLRQGLAAATGFAALAAALSWWMAPARNTSGGTDAPPAASSDAMTPVVIYLIDTLRADRLGAYGYTRRPTSPNIDALARESVVFEAAYGAAPWTLPSVASLLTSTLACEHGVVTYGRKLNANVATLAERLAGLGFQTAAYFSNMHAGSIADLSRGYRIAEERPTRDNDRSADAGKFLAQHGQQPFLLYLHTMEPHEPFHTPAPVINRFGHIGIDDRENFRALWARLNELRSADWSAGRPRGATDNSAEQTEIIRFLNDHRDGYELLYDAAVAHADEHLGQTIAVLRRLGLWDRVIFIVLADHGEEFGEHGNWLHGQSVYEEQLRVPLLVRLPRGEHGGRRIANPVSIIDMMPTVLDYLGRRDLCEGCRGRSLLPLLRSTAAAPGDVPSSAPGPVPAVQPGLTAYVPALRINELHDYRPARQRRGDVNVVARRGDWKAIWNRDPGSVELYDLARDPAELDDLSTANPALTSDLGTQLRSWLGTCPQESRGAAQLDGIDERTRQKLRAMGYIN